MHASLFGDPGQFRTNGYKLWTFPDGNPFPMITAASVRVLQPEYKEAKKDPKEPTQRSGVVDWRSVVEWLHVNWREPMRPGRRWRRRIWRVVTINGLLVGGYFFIKLTLGASMAYLLAQLWGAFLQKHVEATFGDGSKEFPDWGQNLGMCIAVTAVAGIVPSMAVGADWFYHTYCRDREQNIRRQSYTDLIEEARRHDAYMPSHEWDYDSENEEPLPAYLYYLAKDNQEHAAFTWLWGYIIDTKDKKKKIKATSGFYDDDPRKIF